jgi:hypothetical protein
MLFSLSSERITMSRIREMSDRELRIALASALPYPWENIRTDDRNRLIGDVRGTLSERPSGIPNWPEEIDTARFLEDAMKTHGVHDEYVRNLAEVMRSDPKSAQDPTARQISEAALMALRGRFAACVA